MHDSPNAPGTKSHKTLVPGGAFEHPEWPVRQTGMTLPSLLFGVVVVAAIPKFSAASPVAPVALVTSVLGAPQVGVAAGVGVVTIKVGVAVAVAVAVAVGVGVTVAVGVAVAVAVGVAVAVAV